MTNGSFMKVESNTFDLQYAIICLENQFSVFFTQILMYCYSSVLN